MSAALPRILLTGASGFIGRHFISSTVDRCRLFCIARRSQTEVGVRAHENLKWVQVDIANRDRLLDLLGNLREFGGIDHVIHLAGYYDFDNVENLEYSRTNVIGTKNVLLLARLLDVRQFIFAGSLAACDFPAEGTAITEASPPTAEFPYARSKARAEQLVAEYAQYFHCVIVRLAAVFSDWCEYPPLYLFLQTWLSGRWNARILGGRGESALTFIHVNDVIGIFLRIIERNDTAPALATYLASPSGATTHRRLFHLAMRYFFGQGSSPICVPKYLAAPGILVRQIFGALIRRPPYERIWMLKYIDRQLTVDAGQTNRLLDWQTTPRLSIERRLLYLIENLKSHHDIWYLRNEISRQRVTQRPGFLIYETLVETRDKLCAEILAVLTDPGHRARFLHYQQLEPGILKWYVSLIFQLLVTAVRIGNRNLLLEYGRLLADQRLAAGFTPGEVEDALKSTARILEEYLRTRPELRGLETWIHDYVTLNFQLIIDEVQDSGERRDEHAETAADSGFSDELPLTAADFQQLVRQLEELS
ncbi:MAG: NAD(P)-dependent oxidoreductase [Candidatus Neomarinimicrobiota bacterium]